jgi:hypothetical protein
MATTTPNFGWPVPTSTDLVKDGATAIEALGDGIDTSMVDLKGGTTGQILAKATNADMDFAWITNDVGDITAITASSPLTGGGTSGDVTIGILDATTSNKGAVQLSTSTSSTSTTLAATASAVKSAYDLATTAETFVGCRVYASSAQSIANATDTAVAFANESYDTNGFHSNVTNNARLTIPAGLSGYYRFTANIGFATNASGRRIYQIQFNGGASLCAGEMTPATGIEPTGTITGTFYLSAGDYINLFIFQNSGGSLNTSGNATRDYLEIERVGA